MNPTHLTIIAVAWLGCSSAPASSSALAPDATPQATPAGESAAPVAPRATEPAALPSGAGPAGDMGAMLAAHNQHRASHCAPALAWSEELARGAQAWADGLAKKSCRLEHSQAPLGENLAAGTEASMGPQHAVELWYEERKQHDFGSGGFSMKAGHFTQLVWRGSQRIGCGTSTCNGLRIWVCNYDPPGNMARQFRENVLPSTCKK